MTDSIEKQRSQRGSLPITKIKKLAKLAIEFDLAVLEVGDIRIVPNPQRGMIQQETFDQKVQNATNKQGKPLSQKQKEDLILFGAIFEEDDVADGH
jgi:hypothetical protein